MKHFKNLKFWLVLLSALGLVVDCIAVYQGRGVSSPNLIMTDCNLLMVWIWFYQETV